MARGTPFATSRPGYTKRGLRRGGGACTVRTGLPEEGSGGEGKWWFDQGTNWGGDIHHNTHERNNTKNTKESHICIYIYTHLVLVL